MARVGGFRAIIGVRPQRLVLMYHRVGPPDRRGAVSLEAFEQQVRHLRSRHQLYTSSGLVRRLTAGAAAPDAVAITVDDGYSEVYENIFPLLRRLAVPATLYVVTDFVDGLTWLWPDQMAFVMLHTQRKTWSFAIGERRRDYVFASLSARLAAWSDYSDWLLTLPPPARDEALCAAAGELGVELPREVPAGYRSVTWDQLREMADAGIEIGSHSCSHPRLTLLDDASLKDEMVRSKARLEAMLDRPVRSFCYPHGTLADVDARVADAARAAGYENAVISVAPGSRSPDPFLVPRYSVGGTLANLLATLARVEPLR